ncbi:hypothetical protein Anapl_17477, partial [Anas platyrhynchos]
MCRGTSVADDGDEGAMGRAVAPARGRSGIPCILHPSTGLVTLGWEFSTQQREHPHGAPSPKVLQNETFVDLMDLLGNFTTDEDYLMDYSSSEPCHNAYCPFFQRAAPAFLATTC